MAFTQVIEVRDVRDEEALDAHLRSWHAEQAGIAPGYVGARMLADHDEPGRYLIEVDFTSEEDAARNNDREETRAWAERLRSFTSADPDYRNLRLVCTTDG
jgi:quinol monooxygenase YgiN